MNIAYFSHSLASCWNHGNAHFVRGVLRELIRRGHQVRAYEPQDSWSLKNLLTDHGEAGLQPYFDAYPELSSTQFGPDFEVAKALDDVDLAIVHEWNDPALVTAIGRARTQGGRFTLLFHDTHHRAVSDPAAMRAFDLCGYDGVLAFGESLAAVYRAWGWGDRVIVWHEAADVTHFHPPETEGPRRGLVWIGNWGDGERAEELEEFLLSPARGANLPLEIYGVRY
ncbi:MAG: glycosyltransferase, partial [Pseudomonadota bacterium]|nr:glycosyltransferase [Pseudomonadota bacterium]